MFLFEDLFLCFHDVDAVHKIGILIVEMFVGYGEDWMK